MEARNLPTIANEVLSAKSNPHLLSELKLELAFLYTLRSDEYADLQDKKAIYWKIKQFWPSGELREKELSDKAIEMKWRLTEEGQKELLLGYTLKSIEKLMSAVNSAVYVANQEAKGQY